MALRPVRKESHDPNRDRDPGQLLWRRTPAARGRRDDAGEKPGHRRGVRLGATLGRGRRGCRLPGRGRRIPGLARRHTIGAEPRPSPHCRRAGGQCRGADQDRGREHRQTVRSDPVRGDPSGGRPGSLLRRRGATSRRSVGGGVHERSHLHDPPRALGCLRPGGAVELPADDGRVEVRSCAGCGEHGRPQTIGHHPGVVVEAGRAGSRIPPARRAQRHRWRSRYRESPGLPSDPLPRLGHREYSSRDGGGHRRLE